jgi:uncharacterized protein (DUF2384 family)
VEDIPEEVLILAVFAIGDREKAIEWLRSSQPALGDEIPLKLIQMPEGEKSVMDVLDRIK